MFRILLISAALVLASAQPALPCGNPIALRGNKAVKKVKQVERWLAEGRFGKVIKALDPYAVEFADKALQRRARLLYFVATVRTGLAGDYKAATEYYEKLLADDPEQPYVQARLAEVYIAEERRLDKARQILDDLVQRDLMPDGEAFAALALLRDRAGDAAGRDDALVRCRKLTRRKAACELPSAPAS